jgi:hypothetical protein
MPELDFSPIGDLFNVYQQAKQKASRDAALEQFAQNDSRFDPITRQLIAADPQTGISLATLAQKYDQRKSALSLSDSFGNLFGGQQQPAPQQQQPQPARPAMAVDASGQPSLGSDGGIMPPPARANDSYSKAIAANESGGRYDALGPTVPSGDRAYGKYQVMGANVGPWTKEVLGQEMTPQQFVASPQAQEAVFNAKFGQYAQKYGPEGAARAWFAGEGGMNDPGRSDPLGTTVASYGQRFVQNGGGAPTGGAPQAATPWPAAPQNGPPQAPQATLGGKPMDQWLPLMMRIATHPDAPPEVQKVATEFIKGVQAEAGLTKEQKEYRTYVQQGGQDDFSTWDRKNRTSSATLINTAPGMDAAQTEARIKIDSAAIEPLYKKAVAGRSAIPLLNRVMELADKTPGGWAGQVSPGLARAFSGLGLPVSEGMSNAELLNSVSRQFIPSVRDPGSTSNYEQQLYQAAVPGLAQSVEGRQKIARMFKAQIDRNNEIVQIYRQNIGSLDLDKKLAALDNKPMFAPDDRQALEQVAGGAGGSSGGGVGVANAASGPPPGAIQALRSNPALRDQFEAKYGQGSSASVLGQ